MRLKARTDKNQAAIVAALRSQGCLVLPLHQVGHGVPDLLVLTPTGQLTLVEVKSPKGKLTPDQVTFHSQWPVVVVRSPAEAEDLAKGGNFSR